MPDDQIRSGIIMNQKTINLNAELREWLSVRLSQVLGNNSDNIRYVEFNVHEAKEDIRYYNNERIKLKLKMSPVQYRTHFQNQVK
jgi:hypothetical protein